MSRCRSSPDPVAAAHLSAQCQLLQALHHPWRGVRFTPGGHANTLGKRYLSDDLYLLHLRFFDRDYAHPAG